MSRSRPTAVSEGSNIQDETITDRTTNVVKIYGSMLPGSNSNNIQRFNNRSNGRFVVVYSSNGQTQRRLTLRKFRQMQKREAYFLILNESLKIFLI